MESSEITPAPQLRKRLKLSGWVIIAGLAVEIMSLFWTTPVAFLVFMFAGGSLLVVGIAIYLHSLVSVPQGSARQ